MTIPGLIEQVVSQTDELFAQTPDRTEARALILGLLADEHFELTAADRVKVCDGVMSALDADEFFGTEFFGDPFKEDPVEPEIDP